MTKARPRKRYGKQIRRSRLPWWQAKEERDEKHRKHVSFSLEKGVACEVRKEGGDWRKHALKVTLLFHRYRWRNQTHYGFSHGEWEIKVERRHVITHQGGGWQG